MKACSLLMGVRFISDPRSWKGGAGAFALALLFVLGIALAQRHGLFDRINLAALQAAGTAREGSAGARITLGMQILSVVGGTGVRLLLAGGVMAGLLWGQRRRAAWWLMLVVIGGTLLNLALKQVFAAPRPDLLPHLDIVHSYSFPSGHAAGNMMFLGALAMLAGRRSGYVLAAMLIALIGISRVWLGVHWPSDVLAGWTEGLGWLALCHVWLPARRREDEGICHASMRGHAIRGDEAMDPETVDHGRSGDQ